MACHGHRISEHICHFCRHCRDSRTRKDGSRLSSVRRDGRFCDLVAMVVVMCEEVLEVVNPLNKSVNCNTMMIIEPFSISKPKKGKKENIHLHYVEIHPCCFSSHRLPVAYWGHGFLGLSRNEDRSCLPLLLLEQAGAWDDFGGQVRASHHNEVVHQVQPDMGDYGSKGASKHRQR